uniref:Uncharacterized protein n=1 Tax=Periophthalmus magnuspinnatus TaxID=409849 RepID=A0A3B4AWK3_9GOBI
MDLPASHYGKLDKRNPVVIAFVRQINSFIAVMKKIACSIKICVEIWKNYKSRLPPSFYLEHMLQVADVLFELKFYDMALWYGYRPHLQQFTSVDILDFEDVDHFKASLFPKGLDTDQDIRALHGCVLCTFEQVKAHHDLTPEGLYKLLCVLDLIRIIMQVFQHYDSLCWQIYNGMIFSSICCICLYEVSYHPFCRLSSHLQHLSVPDDKQLQCTGLWTVVKDTGLRLKNQNQVVIKPTWFLF